MKKQSDGYYHGRITLGLTPVCAVLGLLLGQMFDQERMPWTGLAAALGCLLGLLIDPDLDQEMITRSRWRIIKVPVVGILLGSLWVGLWLPYALMMPHRKLSHVPILGTMTRLAYLAIFVVVLGVLSYFGVIPWIPWHYLSQVDPVLLIYGIGGLCISDIGHWYRDFHSGEHVHVHVHKKIPGL